MVVCWRETRRIWGLLHLVEEALPGVRSDLHVLHSLLSFTCTYCHGYLASLLVLAHDIEGEGHLKRGAMVCARLFTLSHSIKFREAWKTLICICPSLLRIPGLQYVYESRSHPCCDAPIAMYSLQKQSY